MDHSRSFKLPRRAAAVLIALLLALSLALPAHAAGGLLILPRPSTGPLTRGEFVAALYEQSGAQTEAQQSFSDVPAGSAAAQAVSWAAANGIVYGYGDGTFRPDEPVTREQMAAMLYRNAEALGQTPEGDWLFPLGFADAGEVSAFAQKAMEWAVMNRILFGTANGLEPKAYATRSQLAHVLDRWQNFLVPAGQSRGVQILYTSDVHCGIEQGFGYAGLQEIRDALRAQGYTVVLVDDGDNISGDLLGTITKGESLAGLMDQMGYAVAIPGNHEFDFGMDEFLAIAQSRSFPYISCNFVHDGERVFDPYVIRELDGRKVAFVGVTTPKTLTESTPKHFQNEAGEYVYGFLQDMTGEGVYDAVQDAVDAARAEGAQTVVLMAHLGCALDAMPWTYMDVIAHTTGIDVVLDGHSHDTEQTVAVNAAGQNVPRSACGTKLESVGWCFLSPDGQISTGLYSWDRETPAPQLLGLDNGMSAAVADATDSLKEKLKEVVAHTEQDLVIYDPTDIGQNGKPVRIVRRMETNLGDLCADAFRQQAGADIAFVNGGGVRVSIPAGDITLNDIYSVFPFGNSLCMIEVTGQQILDALEWGASAIPGENGGFLQVSGLSYEIRIGVESSCTTDVNGMFASVGGPRRVQNVRVGGEPVDPAKRYTLAGHNYMLLENGDGYTMFDGAPLLLNCIKLDNQLLIDYITDTLGGTIGEAYADPYGQGRIVVTQ